MGDNNVTIHSEQYTKGMGNKILDDALKAVEKYVDIKPYKGTKRHWTGKSIPIFAFKLKITPIDLDEVDSDEGDETSPVNAVNAYNCPPFTNIQVTDGYISSMIGGGWFSTTTNVFTVGGNKYIEYDPMKRHESVVNLLTLLYVSGKSEAEEALRQVLFSALNKMTGVNVETVELAAADNDVQYIIDTLENDDPRLVNRHVLLYGPPGGGKSERVKEVIKRTPEWVHYIVKYRPGMNWEQFMLSLHKLCKFMNRKVMIIVDELDEFGTARGTMTNGPTPVYELLRVMDGVQDMGRVKFLATSNRMKALDPGLKRPGRFYPIIKVGEPNESQFAEIVNFYNARYEGKVDAKKLSVSLIKNKPVGADIRAAFENCIHRKQDITTENVLGHMRDILSSKNKEEDFA